jgi:hypothetical protein
VIEKPAAPLRRPSPREPSTSLADRSHLSDCGRTEHWGYPGNGTLLTGAIGRLLVSASLLSGEPVTVRARARSAESVAAHFRGSQCFRGDVEAQMKPPS